MPKIVCIINQKGGVGKTTVAFNLVKGLANLKYKVLVIDNDPQANLTSSILEDPSQLQADVLGIHKQNYDVIPQEVNKYLHIIGATKKLSELADSNDMYLPFYLKGYLRGEDETERVGIANNYDFVIIDCMPSLAPLNVAAMVASDYLLVPAQAAKFSLDGLVSLLNSMSQLKKHGFNSSLQLLGIVINMVNPQTNIHQELKKSLMDIYGDFVFEAYLQTLVKFEESPVYNMSVMEYAPKDKAAIQFKNFVEEFLKRINK